MAAETLARTYAQAIYEKAIERWTSQLRSLSEALEHSDATMSLDNPAESFDRKKEILNGVLRPETDPEVRNFVYLLASRNEMRVLPAVLAEFEQLTSRGAARRLTTVTSASELSDEDRRALEDKLRQQISPDLDFEYRVDPALLGGVVIRIGDRIIDGSVAGKLAQMRQKLEAR